MSDKLILGDSHFKQLQERGELQMEETHGIQVVIMTVDAHQKLQKVAYDDSEWTDEEQNAVMAEALNDPEGWGAPGMEVYDELYGDKPIADAQDQ